MSSSIEPGQYAGFTPPSNAIRNLQLQGGDPAAILNNSRQLASSVGSSVPTQPTQPPQSSDQFQSIIDLLKNAQQGAGTGLYNSQVQQIQRGVSTPSSLIGASPNLQDSARSASMDALSPNISGYKDLIDKATNAINDYKSAQQEAKANAQSIIHDAMAAGSEALSALITSQPDLIKQAGYSPETLQGAVKGLKRSESIASYKAYGGGGGGGSADDATVLSWASLIKTGQAKLTDITDKNLRNAVANSLASAAGSTPQSDILQTTKDSLKSLQDMVNQDRGFKGAVGSKLAFGTLFGFKPQGVAGSSEADFNAKLKQTVNDVVLPNLTLLHGLGRVTDREFQALQYAITSLSTNMSEGEFKGELQKIVDRVNKVSGSDSTGGAETKLINGKTYEKVPGGWQLKVGSTSAANSAPRIAAAIKTVESGGNYNARGGSGEFGAYQFMPSTWKTWATKYLGNANAQPTPQNQDIVANARISDLLKQGYNAHQVALIWNGGTPVAKKGVNKYGVKYDSGGYAQRVLNALS